MNASSSQLLTSFSLLPSLTRKNNAVSQGSIQPFRPLMSHYQPSQKIKMYTRFLPGVACKLQVRTTPCTTGPGEQLHSRSHVGE